MNDLEHEIRETLHRHEGDVPSFVTEDARDAAGGARRRQIVNVAGTGAVTLVLVIGLVAGLSGLVRADRGPTVLDPPPSAATPPVWSSLQERDALVVQSGGGQWQDPHDTSVDWIDVERLFTFGFKDGGQLWWYIKLAAKPPRAEDLEPGRLIAYGLVLETNGDSAADYLIGINNDAPRRPGYFRVWVTDLATGETSEQIGPPYGAPIEFQHPDEWRPADGWRPPTMMFTYFDGWGLADLNADTVRFYAWASETRDGEVIAWDTAPDTGWMKGP